MTRIVDDKDVWRSWTVWFNSLAVVLAPFVPGVYREAFVTVVAVGNVILRFKTRGPLRFFVSAYK